MYAVTGASGHTGRVVAERLLAERKKVRTIGRNVERLEPLTRQGAEAWICDLTDAGSLAEALNGAEAAYVMLPPTPGTLKYRAFQHRVSDALAAAIRQAGVKHVVSLSSFGADKPAGTGPVVGLHDLEQSLDQISGLHVLHLRAGYFMENTLAQVAIIKTIGVVAGPLRAEVELPMIATRDIGEFAAQALLELRFVGHQTRELLGARDVSMAEAASIIGASIGRPQLSYKQLPDEQVRAALVEAGMSEDVADLILEMSRAINTGHMMALEARSEENTTPTSYQQFVTEVFIPQFRGKPAVA
ncbi:MAG TPA: NmrA family NAD(P)-binding protein [Candidatus Acidoferrales bacterium]|nr:NmrA family NAD(P)-binding protein [Candidatus Acidoferrales bacterium]